MVSTEKMSKFKDLVFATGWSSDTENITKAQTAQNIHKEILDSPLQEKSLASNPML
jgi:hypothetical protein